MPKYSFRVNGGGTGGSAGITRGGTELRQAAATAPVAAALANVIFDATGVRVRRVPLKL